MNTFLRLFISYLIFLANVKGSENSSEENETKEQCYFKATKRPAPLVLIREDTNLKLAEPVRFRYRFYEEICYSILEGEFENFCPPNEKQMEQCAEHSLCRDEENILFPATPEFHSQNLVCQSKLESTIKPIINEKPCFHGETQTGTEYQVGYTVWNDKTKNAEHLWVYKICHSLEEGTLYTFHTIRSLNLLRARGYCEVRNESILKSKLGENKAIKTILTTNKNYQFIDYDDMPVYNWAILTLLDFNIVSVKGEKVLLQLQTVDNIIRMSVVQINKPVKVYTGKFQTTKSQLEQMKGKTEENTSTQDDHDLNNSKTAPYIRMELFNTEYTFIWKILQHDTEGAVAIITQINPFNRCFQICPNIANDENWSEFKHPTKKQCTYACQVTKLINKLFGLPDLGEISKIMTSRYIVSESSVEKVYASGSKGYTGKYGEKSHSNWLTGWMLAGGGDGGGGWVGGGGDGGDGGDAGGDGGDAGGGGGDAGGGGGG